jgi:receptor protein-tyrosine kinase
MSRVHDALRKAQQGSELPKPPPPAPRREAPVVQAAVVQAEVAPLPPPIDGNGAAPLVAPPVPAAPFIDIAAELEDLDQVIQGAHRRPYQPVKEALLVDPSNPREAPAEEFRTLRTRLNHLQSLQPLHTLVVTSSSPAEGKSFTAMNLALTQSQLADKRVLLADFDFRRPSIDKTLQLPSSPGITDYLLGKACLRDIMSKVGDTNLYVLPAGNAVPNPLELLNLKECRALIDGLRNHFDWVILDSPPLLFAADGNLLATMCDGTILVVRIGTTTFDCVTRALQSLCENNVLGVVVNGARRGELYSKYTYYHDYYYSPGTEPASENAAEEAEVAVGADE